MRRARNSNLESAVGRSEGWTRDFKSVEFFGDRGSVGGVGGSTFGLRKMLPSHLSPPPSLKASQEL